MSHNNKIEFHIHGMTCQSCEILIERKFQKIPGVKYVKVNHMSGRVKIHCHDSDQLNLKEFHNALVGTCYIIAQEGIDPETILPSDHKRNTKDDYFEMGAVLIIMLGLYMIFRQTKIFDFNIGISDNMSYGFILLIGLVAGTSSCIAVTGGVLISLAAKYNEAFRSVSRFEKFKPHLFFNIGRIIGYTVFGGLLGALGSTLTISPWTTGVVTLVAAAFMVLMGLKILKLFPSLSRLSFRMPKFLSHKILEMEGKQSKTMPFVVGSLTFFLPCGFTQALQLYAISRGSMVEGALIMFFFSLGTFPALLTLSTISSVAKGSFQRYFLKISGVLVLVLGISSIGRGFSLIGVNVSSFYSSPPVQIDNQIYATGLSSTDNVNNSAVSNNQSGSVDPNVEIVDGFQVVKWWDIHMNPENLLLFRVYLSNGR
jgi:sulfite exporter TauE/SafE/copper chaperone CopZ